MSVSKEIDQYHADLLAVVWLIHAENPINTKSQLYAAYERAAEVLSIAKLEPRQSEKAEA